MADVWTSEEFSNGMQIRAAVESGGLLVSMHRRMVSFQGEGSPPATTWFIHSRLILFWPTSIEETMRLVDHWLSFYDSALKTKTAGLVAALSAIPEAQRSATSPPQGTNMN